MIEFLAACVQKGAETCAQPASVSQDHFTVIVTAIVAGFGSLMTLLGVVYGKQRSTEKKAEEGRRHAESASFGINNHHKTNFRDDFDMFKRDVFIMFGRLNEKIDAIDDRVDVVEETQGGRHATTPKHK